MRPGPALAFVALAGALPVALPAITVRGAATAAAQTSASVTIADFSFLPPSLTVQLGAAGAEPTFPQPHAHVGFTNTDSVEHNVTFGGGGPAPSPNLPQNGSHDAVFTAPGTFSYRCTIHPSMQGTVTVTGTAGTTTTTTTTAPTTTAPTSAPTTSATTAPASTTTTRLATTTTRAVATTTTVAATTSSTAADASSTTSTTTSTTTTTIDAVVAAASTEDGDDGAKASPVVVVGLLVLLGGAVFLGRLAWLRRRPGPR